MMNSKVKNKKRFQKSKWFEEVEAYIEENIGDAHLTATEIASAVYTSERQFYRRVKQCTGRTPNRYLQLMRLRKAKELLESNQCKTVKEVANRVGYVRSDYFSRLYKARYGIRPIAYFSPRGREEEPV